VATALTVVAGLIKPQGALLLPALFVILAREGSPKTWLKATLAGLAPAALVLLPWWSQATCSRRSTAACGAAAADASPASG